MKSILRAGLKRINLDLINLSSYGIKIHANRFKHHVIIPRATYSPWFEDLDFMSVYNAEGMHNRVDMFRCYELWTLVKESSKLEGALLEVGVWRGGTSSIIAKSAQINKIKEPVYLADTFTGVVKAGVNDSKYQGGEHSDTTIESVSLLLKSFGLSNFKILKGVFPEETSISILEPKLRFCHIDVDVYQSAKDILEWIWDKMDIGGIIVFDDYGFSGTDGITQLVEEQRTFDDRLVIHNLNGHGILIKIR